MSDLPASLRLVPTLTDIVQPGFSSPSTGTPAPDFSATIAIPLEVMTHEANEAILVQRVLQRIEPVLAQRLRDVVDHIVQEHTQALVPRLRQEIELVVRESVVQAFAQEDKA